MAIGLSSPGQALAPRRGYIPSTVEDLQAAVASLWSTCEELHNRLSPVLAQEGSDAKETSTCSPRPPVPLAKELGDQVDRLLALRRLMQQTLDCLEL